MTLRSALHCISFIVTWTRKLHYPPCAWLQYRRCRLKSIFVELFRVSFCAFFCYNYVNGHLAPLWGQWVLHISSQAGALSCLKLSVLVAETSVKSIGEQWRWNQGLQTIFPGGRDEAASSFLLVHLLPISFNLLFIHSGASEPGGRRGHVPPPVTGEGGTSHIFVPPVLESAQFFA